jgi:hypothetical protein
MHRNNNTFRILFAVTVLLSLTAGMVSAVPVTQSITYQGKLTDAAGNPLTGTYTVMFSLYEVSSGGTALATDTHSVEASKGLFTTQITSDLKYFDGRALWLGIKVGADPAEMNPRQEIRPVPYALSIRPGATVMGSISPWALKVQNSAGTGLAAITGNDFNPGMTANTSGDHSSGLHSETHGNYSPGMSAVTTGLNSPGVYTETHSDYSPGMGALTDGINSPGIFVNTMNTNSPGMGAITNGLNSPGVHTETHSDYSPGMSAVTNGLHSSGVHTETHSDYSPGMSAVTTGLNSPGVYTETHSSFSSGMSANTTGFRSSGVNTETHGDYSPGINTVTNGTFSPGVNVNTMNTSSPGIRAFTYGAGAHGMYVETSGARADGVYTYSEKFNGIYAETGNATHHYGVYTPDYLYAKGTQVPAADVAEYMPVIGSMTPATVLVIGTNGKLQTTTTAYDTRVAGIVSTEPGVSLGTREDGNPGEALIAVAGRVPCKVDATSAPIHAGDLLTSSNTPGYAMKATNPQIGTILGKAMGSLESGTGTIEVLVTLQ